MEKVIVKLENCYGIKKLEADFDFSEKKSYVIYAPNGVMKSSFAETFKDLSNGAESKDRIYKERTTIRSIQDEGGKELLKEQIFVIEPYNQTYKSSKISTLLVNKVLKDVYDEIHLNINEKKETLLKELKASSGVKKDIEETLSEAITHDRKEFFRSLSRVKEEVLREESSELSEVIYPIIFNDKVLTLLEDKDFKNKLEEYIKIYDQLISSSNFFQKGVFNHNNAADIAKSLKSNGYFKAKHSVNIQVKGGKREITSEKDLEEAIQQEKDSILEDKALAKSFEEIDDKLTKNKDLVAFREYIGKNKVVISELMNLDRFNQKLWIAYLTKSKDAFNTLMEIYEKGKEEIEKIIQQAKEEATKWNDVIAIFNDRFSVPFIVSMKNQDDVILKSDAPNLKFEFRDSKDGRAVLVEENDLLKVLSNGEKRALYILNIIFEVEARKAAKQETLFVIDDIADLFDYKNKYAIIQYLKDISNEEGFFQIILSHNFDFYRTISGRLDLGRDNKLHTVKSDAEVKLVPETYQNNPFDTWKRNFAGNDEMLIASIPFIRNLAEYCGFDNHFIKLTSLLHKKTDTDSITIDDLEAVIKVILQNQTGLTLENKGRSVKEVIYSLADAILIETDEVVELEKKITLSIAIRLKAEEYLILKINDDAFVNAIEKNQTFELFKKYKEKFPTEIEKVKLMERVNLMTPENIHLNSFMYEPILDMSNEHLKGLYKDLKDLPTGD